MAAKLLRIQGRVQGVYYRAWTVKTATALGLTGWVRNRSDGSVEALAMGSEDSIHKLITACRQGPPAARVLRVDVKDGDSEALDSFEQRPTF